MNAFDPKSVVSKILEGTSPREAISNALGEDCSTTEGATITKKVVRNGKVVKKKVQKYKKKKILTAAQKKAIKKAQVASKKATAKTKRIKSLKKAATLEGVEEELTVNIICPACAGQHMELLDDIDNATIFVCPDCGKQYALVDAEVLNDLIADSDDDDEDVDIDIFDDEDGDTSDDIIDSEGVPAEDAPVEENISVEPTPEDTSDDTDDDDEDLYFED